jgi:transposase
MPRRRLAISKCLAVLLAALFLSVGEASAQPQAGADADAAKAAQKAYAKRQAALQRRRDAEARLDQTLKAPPQDAPHWMKRAAEKNKALTAQGKGKAR